MNEEINKLLQELREISDLLEEIEYEDNIDNILKNCLYFMLILDSTKEDKELSSIVLKDAKIFVKKLKEELAKEKYPDLDKLECMKNFNQ